MEISFDYIHWFTYPAYSVPFVGTDYCIFFTYTLQQLIIANYIYKLNFHGGWYTVRAQRYKETQ